MFFTDDLQGDYERMKASGAESAIPPTDVTASKIAMLNDTCGNLIQVTQLMCCQAQRRLPNALVRSGPQLAKLIRGSWFAKVVLMSERSREQIRELLDSLYRVDSGRILATLIRLLGDFDLAEEAMHEAFAAALSLWPRSDVPATRDHG